MSKVSVDGSESRDFDLVVHGATGFTGRQAAVYVAEHAPEGLRWAISGRSAEKLAAVQASLAAAGHTVPVIVADSHDAVAIDALARRTRVVLTTVGPYAKFGTALLAACAAAGTDYVDITGETPWVRDMIDVHHHTAQQTGAVIVPFCGFDSIPSDLGVWMLVDWIRREWGLSTRSVRSAYRLKGGFNGGTLDSAFTMAEQGTQKQMGHPFLLNPDRRGPPDARASQLHADPTGPWHDAQLGPADKGGLWLAPFFMAPVNSRVVRRSAAVWQAWGQGYGDAFAYREGMMVRSRGEGLSITLGSAAAVALLATGAGRALARRFVPKPGEGPTEARMDGGFFTGVFVAEAEDGRVLRGRVHGDGDPGNRCTVRMLCESAFCLVLERERLPVAERGGGVWTPATAFGGVLLQRLRAAGMDWVVEG